MNSDDTRVHFVVGYPRSGTTMLAAQLGRFQDVAVTPETNFFRGAYQVAKERGASGKQAADILFNDRRIADLGVDFNRLDVEKDTSIGHLYKQLLILYAEKNKATTLFEKTPLHALYIEEINKLFPHSKIIHLVRDGRDVIISNLKEKWTGDNPYKHAAEWRELILSLVNENQRLLTVKYENFIVSPNNELARIALHTDCGGQGVVAPSSETVGAVVPDWEAGWKAKALEKPDAKNAYKWKQKVNVQIVRTTAIMSEALALHGYQEGFEEKKLDLWGRVIIFIFSQKNYRIIKLLAKAKRDIFKANE